MSVLETVCAWIFIGIGIVAGLACFAAPIFLALYRRELDKERKGGKP